MGQISKDGQNLVNWEKLCEEKWWVMQVWNEWWEDASVCLFPDASYCLTESLETEECEKIVDSCLKDKEKFEILLKQGDILSLKKKFEMEIGSDVKSEEVAHVETDMEKCDRMGKDIVCGKDWNTYFNRCYLKASGIEEETQSARVENGECVYN